jgi:hypothetical protein
VHIYLGCGLYLEPAVMRSGVFFSQGMMPGFLSGRMDTPEARSPSGKAKVCKTFIGGSTPPRASKTSIKLAVPANKCCIDFKVAFLYL